MKANLKGLSGIKGLALLHGEKLAMLLVGLLALWFVYSSLQLPTLKDDRQADDLKNEITQTHAAVENATWPSEGDAALEQVRIAKSITKGGNFAIDHKAYATTKAIDSVVVAPTVLRVDPVLLNAVEPVAHGGSGLFGFVDQNVRNARALAARQKEQEMLKKQEEDLRKQQEQQENGQYGGEGAGGRGDRMGLGGEGGYGGEMMDPEHPKRRMVEAMVRPTGIPLQGDERVEQVYWAAVVAKVPIREQMKLYEDAFKDSRGGFDPMRDFPRYVGYQVERCEVVRGQESPWQPVPVYDGQRQSLGPPAKPIATKGMTLNAMTKLSEVAALTWAGQAIEAVDDRYLDYILSFPLPPLAGRDWGADVTHPDIPLAINTPPLEEEIQQPTEVPGQKPEDMDDFQSSDPNQMAGGAMRGFDERGGMMGGGRYGGGMEGGMRPSYGGGGRYGGESGRGMMGGGRGMEGGMGGRYGGEGDMRGGMMGGGARSATQKTSVAKGVDFWLLRFFDFSVEPGKRYRYRVKLVLADPNFNLPSNMLAASVLDRKDRQSYRFVEQWSEPTPTVGIPFAGSVRLAKVKLPAEGNYNDEPSASLLVESFDIDDKGNAIQAGVEKDNFRRGYVANMTAKNQEYLGPDGRWIDTIESFKFHTGMTVLDMTGGEQLGRDVLAPTRLLLMGPAGELYIRRELDDKEAIDNHKAIFEKTGRGDGRGGEGFPGMRGGGEGGRGGYGSGNSYGRGA